jgi:hypothetical protein
MTPLATLTRAFRALPRADLKRLKYHLEQKTPICCGADSGLYADGEGGG